MKKQNNGNSNELPERGQNNLHLLSNKELSIQIEMAELINDKVYLELLRQEEKKRK